MNDESAEKVALAYAEAIWSKQDASAIDTYLDESIVIHSLLGNYSGRAAMRDVAKTWWSGFPDVKITNKLVTSKNGVVSVQWNARGTHKGLFKGIQPTGRKVRYSGVTIYRVRDGKIIEYWAYLDMNHLLGQISH